jgi:hypothetical protein
MKYNYKNVKEFENALRALTFPQKRNYVKIWIYKKDEIICKGLYIEEVAELFDINVDEVFPYIHKHGFVKYEEVDDSAFIIAKKVYHSRIEEFNLLFKDYLFEKYDVFGERAELLFDKCRSYSGSTISDEVESLFSTFKDLL